MNRDVEFLDLTGVPCPMNSARALVKLALLSKDSALEIIVDDGEQAVNVPLSLEDEGYHVLLKESKGRQWVLRVQRSD
ncbi:MAG: sulfurtransferase TusA family protein [Candidatus Omnitrophota bacterium]